MQPLDYAILAGYFLIMIGIGVWSSWRVTQQEDFFMGGRSFGKLLQTFAAFGAGTGSSDPVNTGRTTFTSGMSGMWKRHVLAVCYAVSGDDFLQPDYTQEYDCCA